MQSELIYLQWWQKDYQIHVLYEIYESFIIILNAKQITFTNLYKFEEVYKKGNFVCWMGL